LLSTSKIEGVTKLSCRFTPNSLSVFTLKSKALKRMS